MSLAEKSTARLCAIASACAMLAWPASAADGIGRAVGLTPAASGTVAGRIDLGTSVFQDETVKTGPSGTLEIRFRDETRLGLGASSTVKLDRFVYAGESGADAVVIGLTKGAFRLATGSSPKKAYKIQTPLAAIGVRGTEIGVRSDAAFTFVTYYSGAGRVCSNVRKSNCLEVRRGETVAVTRNGSVRKVKEAVLVNLLCSKSGGGSALCAPYGSGAMPNPNGVDSGGLPVRAAPSSPRATASGTKPGNGGGGGECGGGT
jgi:ferric-dicitrate binding protein FerR (iron transport regulator)